MMLIKRSCKKSTCQCRRCRFDPWVRQIPWNRKWQPAGFSILTWEIPWTEEPGSLQAMQSQVVGLQLSNRAQQEPKSVLNRRVCFCIYLTCKRRATVCQLNNALSWESELAHANRSHRKSNSVYKTNSKGVFLPP